MDYHTKHQNFDISVRRKNLYKVIFLEENLSSEEVELLVVPWDHHSIILNSGKQ